MLATASASLSPSAPQIYRQYFTPAECKLLDASPLDTALSEIGLLRILLLRLLGAAHRMRRLSTAHHLSLLTAFSATGLILASLVRFHHRYFPQPGLLAELLADMDPDDL